MRLTPGHAASSPVSVPLAFCRSQNESGTTQETATRSDAVTSGVLVNVYTTKNNDDKVSLFLRDSALVYHKFRMPIIKGVKCSTCANSERAFIDIIDMYNCGFNSSYSIA